MDEIVLISYFVSLFILFVFSSHGFFMIYYYNKYKNVKQVADANFISDKKVTIQLPLYNELYVVERLIDSVCEIDYPKDYLEIQVLDDSTDETVSLVANKVAEKIALGFNILHVRRELREGFKAGALKEGMKT
ncbi:MAG: glycosyltransferase, partial [Ignavibacteria bacterium]|nr:glycosyltransferase [Ignavibacteria bacterium]